MADLRVSATNDGRGNSTRRGDRAKECPGDLRKGQSGIGDDDVGIGDLRHTPMDEKRSGSGGSALPEHPIPCDEGQIVRACRLKAGQAYHGCLWRSYEFSADKFVDLSQ